MRATNLTMLDSFVSAGKFNKAEALCLSKLNPQAKDYTLWLTQLGYIYFLNEENTTAYYEKCLPVFIQLVEKDAQNEDALFWLAYLSYIIHHDTEGSKSKLHQLLRLNPAHSYANLVMAGFSDTPDQEKLSYLYGVLKQQPNNLRAAKQSIEILLRYGKVDEARLLWRDLNGNEPYTETNYGIMNEYINGVLTAALHSRQIFLSLNNSFSN